MNTVDELNATKILQKRQRKRQQFTIARRRRRSPLFPSLLLITIGLLERIQSVSQFPSDHSSNAGRRNWNLAIETFPAVIVYAHTVQDVISCISNEEECPAPLLPVGSMYSVSACLQNNDGTLLDMSQMSSILGYNRETGIVSLQPGVQLADLHEYLRQNHDREISFSPEIGDATVGSLTVATSKDSSINGPGYFSALVTSLQNVNHQGQLITLDRELDATAFQEFICSFGLKGVVVQVNVETRPAQRIKTRFFSTKGLTSADEAYNLLQKSRQSADNVFALVSPHEGIMVTMERYNKSVQDSLLYRVFNNVLLRMIQRVAFITIQHGIPFSDARSNNKYLGWTDTIAKVASYWIMFDVVHYRNQLTNRYSKVMPTDQRLDFSFALFDDETKLEQVFKETYQFTQDWFEATGFAPAGFNIYFGYRTGQKPFGEFSGPPGVSFAMDPYYGVPDDPNWERFVRALNVKQKRQGAVFSPTQTRFLTSQTYDLTPLQQQNLVEERFLTTFYRRFLASS